MNRDKYIEYNKKELQSILNELFDHFNDKFLKENSLDMKKEDIFDTCKITYLDEYSQLDDFKKKISYQYQDFELDIIDNLKLKLLKYNVDKKIYIQLKLYLCNAVEQGLFYKPFYNLFIKLIDTSDNLKTLIEKIKTFSIKLEGIKHLYNLLYNRRKFLCSDKYFCKKRVRALSKIDEKKLRYTKFILEEGDFIKANQFYNNRTNEIYVGIISKDISYILDGNKYYGELYLVDYDFDNNKIINELVLPLKEFNYDYVKDTQILKILVEYINFLIIINKLL